jgi:hypothetical protein
MQFSAASRYFQLDQNIPLLKPRQYVFFCFVREKISYPYKATGKITYFHSDSFSNGTSQSSPQQNINANLKICEK